MELVDKQQKRHWNHFYPLWEAGSIILKNNEWHSLRPFPSAIDVWKPRDILSEKILITHHCPINWSSWAEAGDEKPERSGLEAIQLDCQALGPSLMATAQALMSMNLIISRWEGESTFLKLAGLLLRFGHSRRFFSSKWHQHKLSNVSLQKGTSKSLEGTMGSSITC